PCPRIAGGAAWSPPPSGSAHAPRPDSPTRRSRTRAPSCRSRWGPALLTWTLLLDSYRQPGTVALGLHIVEKRSEPLSPQRVDGDNPFRRYRRRQPLKI